MDTRLSSPPPSATGKAGPQGRSQPLLSTAAALRDSANPVRELFDAAAQGYTLAFTCRGCGRRRVFHAASVWRHFDRKGWSPWLRDIAGHFRCRVCGRGSPSLALGHDEPTDTSLPLPDRYAWKRELSRRR